MPHPLAWLNDNWFPLLQSLGIVGGLLFTGLAARREARSRLTSDRLVLLEQHRELWSEVHRRPELERVVLPSVDLVAHPVSVAEERFLNLVIVHFHTGWQLAVSGVVHSPEIMAADVRSFFALPLPRAVWEQAKAARDPEFVRFVEAALAARDDDPPPR
jgi:hypothetical protein